MGDQVGEGGINGSGSDDLLQQDDKKARPMDNVNAKQIAHEMLPSRHAMATITGGDLFQRSMGNYAKNAPNADSMNELGMNITSFGAKGGM